MRRVPLLELCEPKQWPTLSVKDFTEAGFPVFGANGIIGTYNEFTHTIPTVLIGCRGSVGAIHVTSGPAYVNGNAMALDNLKTDVVTADYLAWFLRFRGFTDIVSGSSQPQITKQNLVRVTVPVPSLDQQREISARLNAADTRILHRNQQLLALDELVKTLFLGTLSSNVTALKLGELGHILTGKTPPTANAQLFQGKIPFITPGDLNSGKAAVRYVSVEGSRLSRTARAGSALVCCIGTIGKADMAATECSFNQQINAIEWGPRIRDLYGIFAIRNIKAKIVAAGSSTTLPLLPKSKFAELEIDVPDLHVQDSFCTVASQILTVRKQITSALELEKELLSSILSRLGGAVNE